MADGKTRRDALEQLEANQEALRTSIEQTKRLADEAEHLVQRARGKDSGPLPET